MTTGSDGTHYPHNGGGEPQLSGSGAIATYITRSGGRPQVVSHNLTSGELTVASSASDGAPGDAASYEDVLSSNGQWLLFSSDASNLVPGVSSDGTGNAPNLFRKNLANGAVSLAVPTNGPPDGGISPGGISDAGDVIAFTSSATNVVGATGSSGLRASAYLRDLTSGTVQQLLYQPAGPRTQGSLNASVSADGTKAVFLNLDDSGFGTNVMSCNVSVGLASAPACSPVASAFPVFDVHLASNGSAVEYSAANTVESGSTWQVFRADLSGGNSGVASVNNVAGVANIDTGNSAGVQGISGDGSTVFFSSAATNLDPGATDGRLHAFLRTQGASIPATARYVALGDSYSSGEGAIDAAGNAAFDTRTDTSTDKCHRSAHAYAYQLKAARGFTDLNFKFAACSGAVIADFVAKVGASGQWTEGPQLDAISPAGQTNPDTKLVTLSLGGNDGGFPQIMEKCVLGFDPLDPGKSEKGCLNFANKTSAKGFDLLSNGGYIILHPKDGTWVFCTGGCLKWGPKLSPSSGYVALAVPSLSSLYGKIHDRAPNAEIRVLLYPHLFPAQPPSSCTVGMFTTIANVVHVYHLTKNEMTALNRLGDSLNKTISAQVTAARSTGVNIESVDPNLASGPVPGFGGHAICDSETPWINGIIWGNSRVLGAPSAFSFHPNALGQAEFGSAMQLGS